MNVLISLIILAASPSSQTADHLPPGGVIYECTFEEKNDSNYDNWPDHWTRRRGAGFPLYLKIEIEPRHESLTRGNHWLRMELDGGAAQVNSPSIDVSSKFDYAVEGRVRTEGLKQNATHVVLTFFNKQNKPVETYQTELVQGTTDWHSFRIGPLTCQDSSAVRAVVSLHLGPSGDDVSSDLTGVAMYDDLRIYRIPQLNASTSAPCNIVTRAEPLKIHTRLSTLDDKPVAVDFSLLDMDGKTIAQKTEMIRDTFTWEPKFPGEGYYRALLVMHAGEGLDIHREVPIAVVRSIEHESRGNFGWSLDRSRPKLATHALTELLRQAGIQWVKLPLWKEVDDLEATQRLGWLLEDLRSAGIQTVGVLDLPPAEIRSKLRQNSEIPIAEIFSANDLWPPALDLVLTRMSLHLRWWQIGADGDLSFLGVRNMEQRWKEIHKHASQYGTNIRLGMPWPWVLESPRGDGDSLAFLSLESHPAFTAEELTHYLAAHRKLHRNTETRTWVTIESLPRNQFDLSQRARDLVTRMLAAKIQRADAIFATRVFNSEYGLMNDNGSPGELFLPWRTTSRIIGAAHHLGSIQLPGGSRNQVFQSGDKVVMVVWNERPTKERLYLGEDVRIVDVWDRETKPRIHDDNGLLQQEFETGPMPQFLIGCDPVVAKWRVHFAIEEPVLQASWASEQTIKLRFQNTNDAAVDGSLETRFPQDWKVYSPRSRLRLDPAQEDTLALELKLGTDTPTGPHRLRFDFDLASSENYKFDVYETVVVGEPDVELKLTSHIDESGQLIVEQSLLNRSEELLSFGCMLFIPDRGREWQAVRQLGRGQANRRFVIPNGKELIGKTLSLRATELGGDRVLNAETTVEAP